MSTSTVIVTVNALLISRVGVPPGCPAEPPMLLSR